MALIGIDPGIVGAWAVLNDLGTIVAIGDLPIAGEGARRSVSAPLFAAVMARYLPTSAIVETVGPMPKQGISSTFKFARSLGIIEGVIGSAHCPISYVSPTVWKRHYQLGSEKEQARQRAINTWPEKAEQYFARKKDHGRAEACLIALWGLRVLTLIGGTNAS